jgi:hypothetical protein
MYVEVKDMYIGIYVYMQGTKKIGTWTNNYFKIGQHIFYLDVWVVCGQACGN